MVAPPRFTKKGVSAATSAGSSRRRRRDRCPFPLGYHQGMNILIVRLSALGDVVHAIPAAAALRRAFPEARIDWLVEARHRDLLDLVTVLDRVVVVRRSTLGGWTRVLRELRTT